MRMPERARSALKLGTDAQLSASLPGSPTLNLLPVTSVHQIHMIAENPPVWLRAPGHTAHIHRLALVTRNGLFGHLCVREHVSE